MKTRDFIYLLIISLLFLIMCRRHSGKSVEVKHTTDTVRIRDTIREPVPQPYAVYRTIRDTVEVPVIIEKDGVVDTVRLPSVLEIERKEYRSENYYAVVQGFRPELLRLDLYPEREIIYNTEVQRIRKNKRFGVGVQVGYGITGNELRPYIGVGLQYNFITF